MNVSAKDSLHNTWNNNYLAPGPVGSLGATHIDNRLKHSAPELPIRWDKFTHGPKEERFGTNLTDGDFEKMPGARLTDWNWDKHRKRYHISKTVFSPTIPEDTTPSAMAVVGPTPQYGWKNSVASVYKSMHTGNQFLPMPGAYELKPGQIPRGGNVPRIVSTAVDPEPLLIPPAPSREEVYQNSNLTSGSFVNPRKPLSA